MIINSPLDVMASASTQQSSNESTISSSKSFIEKTVCLEDWWLEKPENNSKGSPLAIAGTTPKGHTFLEHTISSHRRKPVRWFSAPIWKRHDVTTLETVDGVFVIIKGFMNKAQTTANGFSSEICKYFVYGFPSDWEKYAKKCYGGECPLSSVSIRSQDLEPLSPLPMDGDNAIENAEAIPAYKSRRRLVLKQILNDDDMKTITPPVRHTRRSLSSAKQKRKQKEKPEYKSAYGSSTSRKRKDKSSAVSHVTSSVKRSRSGRLLLPKLEFWRNQLAIYDAEHPTWSSMPRPCSPSATSISTSLLKGRREAPYMRRLTCDVLLGELSISRFT